MERFVEIFKRHPWGIAGAILAVVVLIWYFSRGSSTPQMAVYSSGPTDAQVQGAYALQAAQISANAATAQAQLQNEQVANDNATAVTINAQNTGAATAINSTNASAAVQINQQNVTGATAINQAQANAAVTMAGYQRDVEINGQNTDLQVQSMAEDTARYNSVMAMLGATNPKGGMATYVTTSGQTQTIGINNRNPFGMKY
jgi:hypothetical protein